jgi:GH35 family endo-1,4-beta-xylanase
MNKKLLIALCFVGGLFSCADNDMIGLDGTPDKPARLAAYEYLDSYSPLKTYIDKSKYPNFKLGTGVTVADYNNKTLTYRLVNTNFDEIVAGNAMKMASCVNDKGEMDFSTVQAFISSAEEAGANVYGHTLAWHAQQPMKWLNSLIADRPVEVDPDAMEEVSIHECDYANHSGYPWYRMSDLPQVVDGVLVIDNPTAVADWQVQYFVDDQVPTEVGADYIIRTTIRGSEEGSLKCNVGDWGSQASSRVKFTTEWQTVDCTVKAVPSASSFVVFQSGDFVGKIEIKKIEVLKLEVPAVAVIESILHECDYANHNSYPWYRMSDLPQVVDGVLVIDNPTAVADWQVQYFVDDQIPTEEGEDYVVRTTIRGSKEGSIKCNVGDWGAQASGRVKISTEWETVDTKITAVPAKSSFVVFQSGDYVGKIEIKKVQFIKQTPSNVIPLTDQEKKDTLTWAMDKWIKGMMEACEGKVKAWDVVNEAISGGDTDGDGVYDLQHGKEGDTENFFWQDYLGDLDYVRTAVRLAREYGPEDIKLFVNDYNLEYDWDASGNKKLESLIKWIERWESDGITKIDGIGTQMHISCYADPTEQNKRKELIKKSFELMAKTGKLVRVSELDISYIDADGKEVDAADMTETQLHEMADFYKWLVQQYLELIPANQQWGICFWTCKDDPASSSWRHVQLYGFWDKDYYRTHSYAGVADALSGK